MWKPIIEIIILWFIIYNIMLFFEGTRAIRVLRGIVVLLVAFFLFHKLRLGVLSWLLDRIFGISIIAMLIIFHPEIRRGLARLGQRSPFSGKYKTDEIDQILNELVRAVDGLAKDKYGGLIAIERNDGLNNYIESGAYIDARISHDLIQAIFSPSSILHDGGIIIQNGRISAAGCLFPLVDDNELSRVFGTRHRAALGLSEETDAVVIVISEERQDVSLVFRSKLYKDLSKEEMVAKIKDMLSAKKDYE